ncbi:formate dehydrogenase accessory sulfurtransferase FdhD [Rubritalea sp.]|uniref:formate dehydrogenase accessory sulfurtransferase FdhD n=1 Tax=Rubritalea sp. TaxID=2109375 RepID=UPI003EF43569
MSSSRSKVVQIYKHGFVDSVDDSVAVEEPLQITLDGCPIAVVMRTPCDDADLVKGFLLTEGILTDIDAVSRIDLEQKLNHALVFLKDDVEIDYQRLQRNLYSASSCGICGKATIESIRQEHPEITSTHQVSSSVLLAIPDTLRAAQKTFGETGGLHAAGLFSLDGDLLVLCEDVGRHNAIDKIIGWAATNAVDFSKVLMQVSGRVSFEVMQKAHAVGIPIISAISAPTSLAVDFAEESGQTLIGFLRPPRFNCYAGSQRLS